MTPIAETVNFARMRLGTDWLEHVRSSLSGRPRRALAGEPTLIRAAVLFPLMLAEDGVRVLLTRRTETVGTHKGQISFPGGKTDPGDESPLHTALREAHEELAIQPEDVDVLGWLDDSITITNFLVTPIVGTLPHPYPFQPLADEIAEVMEIPIERFLDPSIHRVEERGTRLGQPHLVHFYDVDGTIVWGATARFIHALVRLAFPDHAPPLTAPG
ncbi:MAG: CoA pyrophosphatase [bacterium]